ncbi:NAD-dependent deacetylase hst3 [Cladophialophora chaetospira]|uniref:NAD-dependent deacetylase hst3 n=1 Tax=Cladophialophora chaetospira TaxID=386627 RepID=A0AA38X7A7_9EURO|nr:NAD-dependent deacetylase hst3 [Cladophialophora chaetospira]
MGLREVTVGDERALQENADCLAGSHKILLVTGAGISTSCGIPDFRSKDGLYNLIPSQTMLPTPPSSLPSTPTHDRVLDLLLDEEPSSSQSSQSRSRRSSSSPSSRLRGQDLFDSRVFQNAESTTVFYRFIASMRQKIQDDVRATSSVHKFIKVLRDGGRLMRCYTQNIDGLEAREGLVTDLKRGKGNKRRFMKKHYEAPRPAQTAGSDFDGGCEVVQLHGDLDKLRCNMCSTQYEWRDEETDIYLEGAAPHCPACREKSEQRQATGKRGLATGSLRPNIVLYGEDHPSNTLLTPLIPFDASCQPEVLVIMGTSLKVFGLQKIVREFAKAIHSHKSGKGRVIFVNRTRPAESAWEGIIDDFVAMDCDEWVEDLRRRRHDLWLRQGEIDLTVTKSAPAKRKRKSTHDDAAKENNPIKKQKVVVEVPGRRSTSKGSTQGIMGTKLFGPKKSNLPQDYTGRAILSPLAHSRRPPVSPFTSPIRGEEEPGPTSPRQRRTPIRPQISPFTSPIRPDDELGISNPPKRATPKRPAFSPFTPGLFRQGSKLKVEVFQDTEPELQVLPSSPCISDSEPELEIVPEGANSEMTRGKRLMDVEKPKESQFVSQLWHRVRGSRFLGFGDPPTSSQESADDDVVEVSTPSKGPHGRTVDVFAR